MSFLSEQQEKANQNLERVTLESRIEDRTLWEKLITVILAVLGFSLTIFSTNIHASATGYYSKYFLLSSWILYTISLFIGFFLLKKETLFQRKESLRNTLYAMDNGELLDDRTLQVKEDKKGQFVALQVLRGKSIGPNNFWSKSAMEMYEKHKKELNSYKLAGEPEKLYSITDRRVITWSERLFYLIIVLATVSLIVSVTFIIF